MKIRANLKKRQGGAVAVMVGISLALFIGFLAMVIDLGHLYLAKSELQNAADAAALAGARDLDGTASGVTSAIAMAQQLAGRNYYDFGNKIYDITDSEIQNDVIDIWVGSSPNDSDMVPAATVTTNALAANKLFLKVHTRNRDLVAWFAPIWNIFNVSTYGMAVAGRGMMNVTPLGICAIDVNRSVTPAVCGGPGGECGFLRGVAYNVTDINPMQAQAYKIWLNPVDLPPGGCDPNHASASFDRPFVCTGNSVVTSVPGEIYANTGESSSLEKEFNSRFDDYGGSSCNPDTAPPDVNIKQYAIGGAAGSGRPMDWMNPAPTQQSISMVDHRPLDYPARPSLFSDWGALWSYSKELNHATGTVYDLSDWPALYGGSAVSGVDGYPATGVPYAQTSGKYFQAPSHPGTPDRRVLNLLIIDCQDPAYPVGPGLSCGKLKAIAVGQFFMPVPANLPGNVYGEFVKLIAPPMPPTNIRLYR